MRLFYAVFLPENVREALALAQEKVRPYRGWKATRPDQLHVTLMFLGEVDETRLPQLKQVGEEAAAGVASFTARLRGTGFFPERGSPRVWFAKAEGAGFGPLAARLRQALPEFAGAQSFKAHVTLARRKGPVPRPKPLVLDLAFQVHEACLVHSELSSSGPTYQVLERFPLAG
ncbi:MULTISPECIES: RNA 2',3'-cyclic phosphodiesterase [unclassified Meiothermus]|uniref:RNA 2',3'-cyclic phosphodiesterase n=1 Tax=unclassified Meiothermus TaxID=370471 RepID=UPI000D7C407A|nr:MULTISPECIES: RNA 2',3'-cyclic phosphodiesterase [unclassified Meiothermus]PZA06685.1 RNA 2',3'-cyclic phosphodiesterase [Meiothermus sp. Pnk-1]RYM36611.1 RNA 2',3'-cyclic phosphodiesterase [Meiothermus sp. PNK-Is4]